MFLVAETREYNSPLREEQARRTRVQILDALVELVSEEGAAGLSIRDLAARAGVSQRTVYRHFADRQELLDGLADHLGELAGWSDLDDLDVDVEALPSAVRLAWQTFDDFERETRALVLLNRDPARLATTSVERGAAINRSVARSYPQLGRDEARGVAGVIRLLASSHSWLRFRDEFEMTTEEGARFIRWALEVIVRDLDRGAIPAPAEDTV